MYEFTKEKLEGQKGQITINFANHPIVYENKDIIGNALQDWLPAWFNYLNVNITQGEHTQEFPDFRATFNDIDYDVEIKTWNFANSPAFDIANLYSFIKQTYERPGKLNAYFIILGYRVENDGFTRGFTVEKVYLKRIWEITNRSKKYPIGLQVKTGQPYAIRPCDFRRRDTFRNKKEFINGIYEAFKKFPNSSIPFTPDEWLNKVTNY
nr:NgoBV family restriction endonuclease [Streptococcus sp. KCJ4932]